MKNLRTILTTAALAASTLVVGTPLAANAQPVSVQACSIECQIAEPVGHGVQAHVELTAERSGAKVTLTAHADFARPLVVFQKRVAYRVHYSSALDGKVDHFTVTKHRWDSVKVRNGAADGSAKLVVKAAKRTAFRAVVLGDYGVKPGTSKVVTK